jgi:hypothetical protein
MNDTPNYAELLSWNLLDPAFVAALEADDAVSLKGIYQVWTAIAKVATPVHVRTFPQVPDPLAYIASYIAVVSFDPIPEDVLLDEFTLFHLANSRAFQIKKHMPLPDDFHGHGLPEPAGKTFSWEAPSAFWKSSGGASVKETVDIPARDQGRTLKTAWDAGFAEGLGEKEYTPEDGGSYPDGCGRRFEVIDSKLDILGRRLGTVDAELHRIVHGTSAPVKYAKDFATGEPAQEPHVDDCIVHRIVHGPGPSPAPLTEKEVARLIVTFAAGMSSDGVVIDLVATLENINNYITGKR